MAIRVRADGRMFCAAMTEPQDGDTYIDDGLHYRMSVVHRVIASEPMERHRERPEWWWRNAVPAGIEIDDFYKQEPS